ncbi:MAG: outer membrane beta-barrel domain-containing protein [Bdellovibrionales bacterium]|nr:outer membrane beta-barrel domain-containing protein [Bdellovibrionales bacterium]
MKTMSRTLGILGTLVAFSAGAQSLPPSAVDAYKVDTQYGSNTAVLKPLFARDGKLELGAGVAYSPISSLMNYYAFTGSLTYHINMRHAIEPLYFGYAKGKMGNFVKNELVANPYKNSQSLSIEVPEQVFAASYLFSPFYSKMHITEQSVAHFDVYMGAGVGLLRDRAFVLDGTKGDLTNRTALSLATGLRFTMPSRWAFRLELRDFIHKMNNLGAESTVNTMQVALSANVFFGAFGDGSASD